MGNTVVLKPASYTRLTALLFAEICAEAGLPPGEVILYVVVITLLMVSKLYWDNTSSVTRARLVNVRILAATNLCIV